MAFSNFEWPNIVSQSGQKVAKKCTKNLLYKQQAGAPRRAGGWKGAQFNTGPCGEPPWKSKFWKAGFCMLERIKIIGLEPNFHEPRSLNGKNRFSKLWFLRGSPYGPVLNWAPFQPPARRGAPASLHIYWNFDRSRSIYIWGVYLQKGLNHFWIECESVQSVWCFMVKMVHFHTNFKNDLHKFAGGLLTYDLSIYMYRSVCLSVILSIYISVCQSV